MGESPLAFVVLDLYLAHYVHPEWADLARMVLARLRERVQPPAGPDALEIEPIWLDMFLASMAEEGFDMEHLIAVVADALQYLVSRKVLRENPFGTSATGQTTRLAPGARQSPVTPEQPAVHRPSRFHPRIEAIRRMSLLDVLKHQFKDRETGKWNCGDTFQESTFATYLPKWLRLAEWLQARGVTSITKVTALDLKDYLHSRRSHRPGHGPVKPQTKGYDLYAFKALWTYLIDLQIIDPAENPTTVPRPKVKETDKEKRLPIDVDKLAMVLNHIDQTPNEYLRHHLRALALVEAFAGPRAKETVARRFQDVDMKTGVCTINNGKGGREVQTVFIDAILAELRWLRDFRQAGPEDFIFPSFRPGRSGSEVRLFPERHMASNTAWRRLHTIGADLGFRLYNHRLRRTAGSMAETFGSAAHRRALKIGSTRDSIDPWSMALLGHRNPTINAGYNDVALADVRMVMDLVYQEVVKRQELLRDQRDAQLVAA